jgi:hypothetical protein
VFVLYPALTIQECAQESRALCLDVTGLLSFVPCRGLDPRYPLITVSLSSISVIHRKLEFLVHATIPAGMVGADTKLTKRAFFQRAVKPNVTYFAPFGSLQSLRKNSLRYGTAKAVPFQIPESFRKLYSSGCRPSSARIVSFTFPSTYHSLRWSSIIAPR